MNQTLRSRVIRLASARPELRGYLLPMLKEASGFVPVPDAKSEATLKTLAALFKAAGWRYKFNRQSAQGSWEWSSPDGKTFDVAGWHGKDPVKWGGGIYLDTWDFRNGLESSRGEIPLPEDGSGYDPRTRIKLLTPAELARYEAFLGEILGAARAVLR